MAGPGKPVDMELKKAFAELQGKMIGTTQQLKISDLQIEQQKRTLAHAKLVQAELAKLPEEVHTYEGIGRMFILKPIDKVKEGLSNKIKTAEEKIKTIETNKTYLEKSLKESENNLRELIMSKQQGK